MLKRDPGTHSDSESYPTPKFIGSRDPSLYCEHALHNTMLPLDLESESESVPESVSVNVIKPLHTERLKLLFSCVKNTGVKDELTSGGLQLYFKIISLSVNVRYM